METQSFNITCFVKRAPGIKVQCLIYPQEVAFHDNTSFMMRHLWSIHHVETPQTTNRTFNPPLAMSRKQKLDAVLVDMIVKDAKPFSIVEDKGFKAFLNLLDPTYINPNRKALRTVVDKYKVTKRRS